MWYVLCRCSDVLADDSKSLFLLVELLHTYHGKLQLCVRICFILGLPIYISISTHIIYISSFFLSLSFPCPHLYSVSITQIIQTYHPVHANHIGNLTVSRDKVRLLLGSKEGSLNILVSTLQTSFERFSKLDKLKRIHEKRATSEKVTKNFSLYTYIYI